MRPRTALSWSSLDLFERSRERWIALYLKDEKLRYNERGMAGIELGRRTAEALETGEATGDMLMDLTLASVPRLDRAEVEIRATLKRTKGDDVPLFGKVDSADGWLGKIIEYKQGTTSWTQAMADKHGQLTFYATIIYLITGRIPDMMLVWIPTESGNGGKNEMIGDVRILHTKRTIVDVLKMMSRMGKVWDEMEVVTNEYFGL